MPTEQERFQIHVQLRGARKAAAQLGSVRNAFAAMNQKVTAMGESLDRGTKKAGAFRQSLTIMRKSIVGLAGASSVFLAIGLGKSALDFEDSMARVRATLTGSDGFNEQMFGRLTDAAMLWGERSRFSSGEVAEGVRELAAAGFKAQEILDSLGGTTDLAGASAISMGEAAGIQASLIRQFGFEANQAGMVADTLTKAVNEGSAELDDLANSFRYIGPIAKEFGTDFQDVVALLEVLGQRGIKGDKAGRALRMGFVRLVGQNRNTKKGLKAMGIDPDDVYTDQGILPLPELLDMLSEKYNEMGGGPKAQKALSQIFGTEALAQWIIAIKNSGKPLDEMTDKIKDSKGAARDFGRIMMETISGGLDEFVNSIQNLVTRGAISVSPQLQAALTSAKNFVNSLSDSQSEARKTLRPLLEGVKNLAIVFMAVAAGALPPLIEGLRLLLAPLIPLNPILKLLADHTDLVTLAVGGLVTGLVVYKAMMIGRNGVIELTKKWKNRQRLLNIVMGAHPFYRLVAVGIALFYIFKKLYNENETFRNAVQATGAWFVKVWGKATEIFSSAVGFMRSNWKMFLSGFANPVRIAISSIVSHFKRMKDAFVAAGKGIKSFWDSVINMFKSAPGKFVSFGRDMGKSLINAMIRMINSGLNKINSALSFTIPVPMGPDITVDAPDVPQIPELASGGQVRTGGTTIVGENGAEVLNLPAGSRVTPLSAPPSLSLNNLATAAGSESGNITVPVYLDGREIARAVHNQVQKRQARR